MKAYENSELQIGQHKEPLTDINYLDVRLLDQMDTICSDNKKHLSYRHFQFMGVISKDLIFGCAFLKAKVSTVVFAYIYLPETDDMHIVNANDLGGFNSHFDTRPIENYETFDKKKLSVIFRQKDNAWKLFCESKHLKADVTFIDDNFEPMCLLTETGGRGFTYAQKFAGIPCKGTIHYKNKCYDLETMQAYAHHDWTGGFLRPETCWKWACFSGNINGLDVGLNISCGVNETSYTENCFWINGKMTKVDFVQFKFDREDLKKKWIISSSDGLINLIFTPKGFNLQKKNLIVAKSNFKQIIGTFKGQLGDLSVDDMYGFVEDQFLKW